MKLAIKICLWILAFVPLIVDPNIFYPFTSGKAIFIQTSLVLAGILILINFFYSREYRDEIVDKVTKYIKHSLAISVIVFMGIFIISTIFAVDKYAAFWGELSRAEGLAGIMFFFASFVFTLLAFEKKDWLWFFRLSLFTSLILLGKEFVEYFHDGISRPGSYIGNPTFLAGYLLFSITSALVIISEVKNGFWKYFSLLIILFCVLGIFIAQTRGTILGLVSGIIIALIYSAFKGRDTNYKIFNLRKVSIILLTIGIIFSGVFAVTRKNEIWQKVPGLSRVALIGSGDKEDLSTEIRLFVYKSSLESINPLKNGWEKLFFGWGPDNFIIASSKYYDQAQYKYEQDWYDRSHNKFLDVLVMDGLFGLLAYLAVWTLLFRYILKSKGFSLTRLGLLVFFTSYLIHLMFVFDEISTYIPFFVSLAFIVYLTSGDPINEAKTPLISSETREKGQILSGSFLVIMAVFLTIVFVRQTAISYWQTKQYFSLINTKDINYITNQIGSTLRPYSLAQPVILENFLLASSDYYDNKHSQGAIKILNEAINKSEEYLKQSPSDFIFMVPLADIYSNKGNIFKNNEYLKKGELYFKKILEFAPNRPDINFGLAINLIYQKKYDESFVSFEKSFSLYPDYFLGDPKKVEGYYASFIKYFYEQKDKENFIKAANRLKVNNYGGSASLDKILDYLNKNGTWPNVAFE